MGLARRRIFMLRRDLLSLQIPSADKHNFDIQ
jgi:hypothetical protein